VPIARDVDTITMLRPSTGYTPHHEPPSES
jgi:hypothetical protein